MWNVRRETWNTICKTWNARHKLQNVAHKIQNAKQETLNQQNARYVTQWSHNARKDMEYETWNAGDEIWNY